MQAGSQAMPVPVTPASRSVGVEASPQTSLAATESLAAADLHGLQQFLARRVREFRHHQECNKVLDCLSAAEEAQERKVALACRAQRFLLGLRKLHTFMHHFELRLAFRALRCFERCMFPERHLQVVELRTVACEPKSKPRELEPVAVKGQMLGAKPSLKSHTAKFKIAEPSEQQRVQDKLADQATLIRRLQDELAEARARTVTVTARNKELEEELRAVTQGWTSATSAKDVLKAELEHCRCEAAELEAQSAKDIAQLEYQLASSKMEQADLSSELEHSKELLASSNQFLLNRESDLVSCKSELEACRLELATCRAKLKESPVAEVEETSAKADIGAADIDGQTAWQAAEREGHTSVLEALEQILPPELALSARPADAGCSGPETAAASRRCPDTKLRAGAAFAGRRYNGNAFRLRSKERHVRLKERIHGPHHPEVAHALLQLADHHGKCGAAEEEYATLQRAFEAHEKHSKEHQSPGSHEHDQSEHVQRLKIRLRELETASDNGCLTETFKAAFQAEQEDQGQDDSSECSFEDDLTCLLDLGPVDDVRPFNA